MKLIKIENKEEKFDQSLSEWIIGSENDLYSYLTQSTLSNDQYQNIRILLSDPWPRLLKQQQDKYSSNIILLNNNITNSITSSYNILYNEQLQYENLKNSMQQLISQSTNSFQKYILQNKTFETNDVKVFKYKVQVPEVILQACSIPYKVIMTQQNFSESWRKQQYYRSDAGNLNTNQTKIISLISKMYPQNDNNRFKFLFQIVQPPQEMIRYVNRRIKNWQIIHPPLSIGNYYIGSSNNTLQFVFYKKLTTFGEIYVNSYKMLKYPSIRRFQFQALKSNANNSKRIITPHEINESRLISGVSLYITNSLLLSDDTYQFDHEGKSLYLKTQYSDKILKNIGIDSFTLNDTIGYYNNLLPYQDLCFPRIYFEDNQGYHSNNIKYSYPHQSYMSSVNMNVIDNFLFSKDEYSNISAICYSQQCDDNKYGFLHEVGKYAIVFKAKLEKRYTNTIPSIIPSSNYNDGNNNLNTVFQSLPQNNNINNINLFKQMVSIRILPENGIQKFKNLLNNKNIGILSSQNMFKYVEARPELIMYQVASSFEINPNSNIGELKRRYFGAAWVSFKQVFESLNLEKTSLYYKDYANKILLAIYYLEVKSDNLSDVKWAHKINTYILDKNRYILDKSYSLNNLTYSININADTSSYDLSFGKGYDFPYYETTRLQIELRFTDIMNTILRTKNADNESEEFKSFFPNTQFLGPSETSLSYSSLYYTLVNITNNLDYRRSVPDKIFNVLFTEDYGYIMYKDLRNTYNSQDTQYPENYYGEIFIPPYTDSVVIINDNKWKDDLWELFGFQKKLMQGKTQQQVIDILQFNETIGNTLFGGKYQYPDNISKIYQPANRYFYSQSNQEIFTDSKNIVSINETNYKFTRKPLKPKNNFSEFNFMFDKYGQFITYRTLNKRYFEYNNQRYIDIFGKTDQFIIEKDKDDFYKCYVIIDKYYQGNSILSFLINEKWSDIVTDKKIDMFKFSLKDVNIYQITDSNWIPPENDFYQIAMPQFSHNSGIYEQSIEVKLFNPVYSSQIRYTLDGTIPNTSSQIYTTPIIINNNTIVSAIIYKDFTESNVAIRFYEIKNNTQINEEMGEIIE